MDKISSVGDSKLVGVGAAKVLATRKGSASAHEVQVFHPDVGNTGWIPFLQTPGLYRIPRIDDICYVFCDENNREYPVAFGHRIDDGIAAELSIDGDDNKMVIYSVNEGATGVRHTIELDSVEDGIRLTTQGENKVNITNDKEIKVEHNSGSIIEITEDEIKLEVKGTSLILDKDGLHLESSKGGTFDVTENIKAKSLLQSQWLLDQSFTVQAADLQSVIDTVIISTHKHQSTVILPTSPPLPEDKQGDDSSQAEGAQ